MKITDTLDGIEIIGEGGCFAKAFDDLRRKALLHRWSAMDIDNQDAWIDNESANDWYYCGDVTLQSWIDGIAESSEDLEPTNE